jgi:excisionase family DNA binding protein
MPPIFVDARELASRLDVAYPTVCEWVRRGKIPFVRDGRGRFNLDSVVTALREKRRETGAAAHEGVQA